MALRLAIAFLGVASAVVFSALPANASTPSKHEKPLFETTVSGSNASGGVGTLSGFITQCYGSRYSTFAGGWCDGNGPDYTYKGVVWCSDGGKYYGQSRWAGDRTGSYVSCPSGYSATRGGVYGYHFNTVVIDATG